MIKYNLKCKNNHEFESWFSDSNEFEKLNKKNLLECIYCESKSINKSIMAPMVSIINKKKSKDELRTLNKIFNQEKKQLLKITGLICGIFENSLGSFTKGNFKMLYFSNNCMSGSERPAAIVDMNIRGVLSM